MGKQAEYILDKVYGNDKAKKQLVISLLDKLESFFKSEIAALTEEEKISLVLQLIGLEKSIQDIFVNGIDIDKLKKIQKVIDVKQVM